MPVHSSVETELLPGSSLRFLLLFLFYFFFKAFMNFLGGFCNKITSFVNVDTRSLSLEQSGLTRSAGVCSHLREWIHRGGSRGNI